MNELGRQAYLRAMGVDTYVSRGQLPGAAVTRRLAVVRSRSVAAAPPASAPAHTPPAAVTMPRIDSPVPTVRTAQPPAPAREESRLPRFTLVAVACGDWLWLEELEEPPFAPAQMQLLQAMVEALTGARGSPVPLELAQFDWPIHTNRQLDLGPEAARSGVAGFVQRKLEQYESRGLVLLGQACEARVPLPQLRCPHVVCTVSTAGMLRDPLLKKQAWRDLRPHFQPA